MESDETIKCPECGNDIEKTDTTYSNVETQRSKVGQHTGDIYHCIDCERYFIDNFLSGRIEHWAY